MGEFDLTDAEKAQITGDVRGLIEADRTSVDGTAELFRPLVLDEGEFDGPYEGDMTSVGIIHIDFVTDPTATVLEPDSDGIADVTADTDVRKWDRFKYVDQDGESHQYRVRHIRPRNCYGARTFKRLECKREYPKEESP